MSSSKSDPPGPQGFAPVFSRKNTISAVCILCVRKASQHVQENDCISLRFCASYALFISITFIVTFPCHPLFSERKMRDNIWLCLSFALHFILNT